MNDNNNDGKNDPIVALSSNNMKSDILFFKDETLKEIKEVQKKMSAKYVGLDNDIKDKLESYENRINAYESKIMELARLINTDKIVREKVDKLMEFKEKVDESMLTERIRLDNFRNDLYSNVNRIDQILKDTVLYPGVIGGICRHKTFHDLIDYILSECSKNVTFREKTAVDFKNNKLKLDNIITSFNAQINKLSETTSEFTKKSVRECEDKMRSIFMIYDDRLQDARIENANYAIGLEKVTETLQNELKNFYSIKKEIYDKVNKSITEMKNENSKVIKLFLGYKKGFGVLQYKFTQLSDFIKDVRFRNNLKEDVNRREYAKMSDLINFDKKKKGFMDGYNTEGLKKGLANNLRDYIDGKISTDELFKKNEISKSMIKIENLSTIEALKRKSLSGVKSFNNFALSEGFTEKIKHNDALRGSMVLHKKGISLENDLINNTKRDTIKKEEIKEENEINNTSRDLKKNLYINNQTEKQQ